MKKTVYPWLDLLKLIMAVSVVAVHTNPLYGFDGSVVKVGVRALAAPVSDIRNQLIS